MSRTNVTALSFSHSPDGAVSEWIVANLPEVTVQGVGSIPILSFTADEILRVQPR